MELTIKPQDRINIIKKIIESESFLGDYKHQEGGLITFLEMIWDLRSMPSTDGRFSNARDDIWKHIVMNDDMSIEELFLDRLPSSYKDDDKFINLINATVHPSVVSDDEKRDTFVLFINGLLTKFNYKLIIGDYFGTIPIYIFSDKVRLVEMPKDIVVNVIPFYKPEYENKSYPCFVLNPDNWDDWYKWCTKFDFCYYPSQGSFVKIGALKIMKDDTNITKSVLPDHFTYLDSTFCSVGIEEKYYLNMKERLSDSYHSVFLALRDTAMFPTIRKEFEDHDCFKNSLLRDDKPKQLLNSARYLLNGIDIRSYYKFSYSFLPPYCSQDDNNDNVVNFDFDFKYGSDFDQRIYALIGKNGTGKTTLLAQMANDFSKAKSKNIIPQKPLYNKVITISFSFFDKLPLPTANAQFNYTYLGLKGNNESDNSNVLEKKLNAALVLINRRNRSHIWHEIIRELFHDGINELLIDGKNSLADIDIEKVMNVYKCFSSGENLLLYIISSLVSEINDNTLLLFDEPETHLHPNAISTLMNALYLLLDNFNSFCIIATHSPLVIQEISSRNIKVLKRNGNSLEIQHIGYETFAENLTTITNEIFGNREVAQYHTNIIKKIAEEKPKKTYEEILSLLQNGDIPTPLNVKLFIKEFLKNE